MIPVQVHAEIGAKPLRPFEQFQLLLMGKGQSWGRSSLSPGNKAILEGTLTQLRAATSGR
jgi:hypothetical protein